MTIPSKERVRTKNSRSIEVGVTLTFDFGSRGVYFI
jgi:hypothetical protein